MPATTIDDLRVVTDLNEGERALPEPHAEYIVADGSETRRVAYVVRRGGFLLAVCDDGSELPIAGEGATHAIQARPAPKGYPSRFRRRS